MVRKGKCPELLPKTEVNEEDVLRSERKRFPPHRHIVFIRPTRFHHAAIGMPLDSLQDMGDLVDHHVSQDYRWRRRAVRLLYPIPEHGDVDPFEGAGESPRAGQEACRCL